MIGIGVSLWGGVTGETSPTVTISAASIAEDALVGDVVGTLSVIYGSGVYTFTITADPDSKFAIDGAALELGATVDYETATSHSVTISADNGVDAPVVRTLSVIVIDVDEGGGGMAGEPIGLLLILTKAA